MIDLLKNTLNCSGCSACANSCTKAAITMTPDKLGFLYPHIDANKCIDCELCIKICPKDKVLSYPVNEKSVLYGVSTSEDVLLSSSSGGAFSEIIRYIEEKFQVYHCYGATFVDGEVKHICIRSVAELYKLKKSKYTQSDLADTFKRIKNDLQYGIYTVFVGTPCQVDGLNSFLKGINRNYLFTIDLLCTGVCSPQLLKNHVLYLQHKRKSNIVVYDMQKKKQVDGK